MTEDTMTPLPRQPWAARRPSPKSQAKRRFRIALISFQAKPPELYSVTTETAPRMPEQVVAEWDGFCPICRSMTTFRACNAWFRDHLMCMTCKGGSIPRERAVMVLLDRLRPNWRHLAIHESSPAPRGVSVLLAESCRAYTPTQFFPGWPVGLEHHGVRCENIEAQTFPDETFDIVVTQDVMEHVFHPRLAYAEIHRTLRPGGLYLHTTPIYSDKALTERKADQTADGRVIYLAPPEYHGNPVDEGGALVTFHFGRDLPDLIPSWSPFSVEVVKFNDKTHGIVGEFTEVIACTKFGTRAGSG